MQDALSYGSKAHRVCFAAANAAKLSFEIAGLESEVNSYIGDIRNFDALKSVF